jgi:hypothetical protein
MSLAAVSSARRILGARTVSRRASRTPRFVPIVPIVAWFVAAASTVGVEAHEIGTTRVAAAFDQAGRYRIAIVTDAASLVEKLDAADSREPGSADAATFEDRLRAADEVFRQRVVIAFNGAAVRPLIAYTVSAPPGGASPPLATILLDGAVPEGAATFVWKYGWTFATYSLTVKTRGADSQATEWLEGGQLSTPLSMARPTQSADRVETARRYLVLGFTHIVPHGLDHMLFVLGIFLLSRRPRQVLMQVSAFTIAHSITLALSMYGILSVSPRIVEPLIAVSIAYVAIENLVLSELKPWRIALVFAFGLLHGMGFAGALKELGLPHSEFVTALVTFNLGVEGGQLAVIAAAFLLVGWHCCRQTWYRGRVVVPASLAIACTAVYWTVERLAS